MHPTLEKMCDVPPVTDGERRDKRKSGGPENAIAQIGKYQPKFKNSKNMLKIEEEKNRKISCKKMQTSRALSLLL